MAVLSEALHVKCQEGAELAVMLLKYTLKSLTSIYSLDYRSVAKGWNQEIKDHLPTRVSIKTYKDKPFFF